MASGAPRPGGTHAPIPGGLHATPAGGLDANDAQTQRVLGGYPDAAISLPDLSGARAAQSRTIVVRLGKAASVTSYAWTLPTKPGGSTATVSGATTATASFTPDVAGLYKLQCVVTFSDGTVVTRSVNYTSA